MSADNMKLWKSVCVTDPNQVKPITGKQYKGNSPKPYYLIERATETFGPCGKGWGIEVKTERFEHLTPNDVLHVALVRLWYTQGGEKHYIEQMGQTKAVYVTKDNKVMVDEDAPKKSVTDGMTKCLSMLGFAGDIFSGRWDDSGYVDWAREQHQPKTYLSEIQINEVTRLINEVGADFAALMQWISKCVGHEIDALKDVPSDAYQPIVKQLNKKRVPT